jgi:DNA invertase Pin-like site-specific DNA recombinase
MRAIHFFIAPVLVVSPVEWPHSRRPFPSYDDELILYNSYIRIIHIFKDGNSMLGIYCRTSKERDFETSTISQQRTAGIKFAEGHKFEYQIYEDEGKSGFKISEDDQDPFNNRPSFTNLINDIKENKIDKVWVWEHSRLSRNHYASAFIFNVFEKYKITLYENQKKFDLDDPQLKFTRQVLDAVSEYERQLIVGRTTRGLHKAINEGKRTYKKLYGYQSMGKGKDGRVVFDTVESEMNNYKYGLYPVW